MLDLTLQAIWFELDPIRMLPTRAFTNGHNRTIDLSENWSHRDEVE